MAFVDTLAWRILGTYQAACLDVDKAKASVRNLDILRYLAHTYCLDAKVVVAAAVESCAAALVVAHADLGSIQACPDRPLGRMGCSLGLRQARTGC
jgi:hypothetical protein